MQVSVQSRSSITMLTAHLHMLQLDPPISCASIQLTPSHVAVAWASLSADLWRRRARWAFVGHSPRWYGGTRTYGDTVRYRFPPPSFSLGIPTSLKARPQRRSLRPVCSQSSLLVDTGPRHLQPTLQRSVNRCASIPAAAVVRRTRLSSSRRHACPSDHRRRRRL